MALFWTLTAAWLYTEAAIITLLLLPVISSRTWSRIFRSRIINIFSDYASFYFNGCLILLGLMLFEALRQVSSQNRVYQELKSDPSIFKPETDVFKRLVTLIADHARVTAAGEASLAQAKSATEAAQLLVSQTASDRDDAVERASDALREELETLKDRLNAELAARESAEVRLAAMKKQAEQTAKEYDRVAEECQQLQNRLTALTGDSGDKKTD